MTIRARLSLNVILVLAVIGALAATSLVGIGFIKAKLFLLTKRSTPYQTRTLEFQRDIQAVTAELIKLGETAREEERAANEKDAAGALAQVRASQEALENLTAQRLTTADALARLHASLSSVVASRLEAGKEATRAAAAMSSGLGDASAKLKALDGRVRDLQVRQSGLYIGSVEEGQRLSEDLRSIEVLRSTLKDIHASASQLRGSRPANWQKSFASLTRRATQNGYVRRQERLRSGVQALIDQVEEAARRGGAEAAPADLSEVDQRYDALMSLLEEDSDACNEKFSDIYGKQKGYAAQANLGVAALSANSNLGFLGAGLDGLARTYFTATTAADLDRVTAEVDATFGKIGAAQRELEKTLKGLGAAREAGLLKGAAGSLAGVRSLLLGDGGLAARLHHRVEMEEKSREAMADLRRMVLGQVEKGKQTVTEARGEQDASIAAVNRVARLSATLITVMAGASVLIGAGFGIWIYRSIARPMNRLIASTDRVAAGDLSEEIRSHGRDEVARVEGAMGKMVGSLRDILNRIRATVQSLASSSEELSATARNLESGSRHQDARIQQSVAAVVQMSKTVQEVARNTAATSEAAARVRESTESGKASMHSTARQLARFADEVRQAADTVESLGERSKEIDGIVALIKDVADQTNLLALNAAIEAARAGDQGRGFAVVAEHVRNLAEKTAVAAGDISTTVQSMQTGVKRSVEVMVSQRRTVDAVLEDVERTLAAIDRTAEDVAQVSQMVQQIAVAAEEQSAATDDISTNMDDIAGVTRQLRQSFEEVMASSESLAGLATELEHTVSWFKQ